MKKLFRVGNTVKNLPGDGWAGENTPIEAWDARDAEAL